MLDNPPGAAPFVSVNAIKTELVQRGSGPPLVFLHPELGIAPGAPVLDALAAKFSVTAPSLPGFGHTDLPRSYSSVDDLAYFTLDVLDTLDLRDVVLVGVSLGGWVAAEVATKSTGRV
jgi:pimeloyl-ACP methyl ester carboxylesterase